MLNAPAPQTQLTDDLDKIERNTKEKYVKISPQFTPKGVAWALRTDGYWYFVGRDYHPNPVGYQQIIGMHEGIALVQTIETATEKSKYKYVVVQEESQENETRLIINDQIQELFDYATLFRHGFAVVEKGGNRYHIDTQGTPLYDPKKFSFVWPFDYSAKHNAIVAEVKLRDGGKKFISKEGKELEAKF